MREVDYERSVNRWLNSSEKADLGQIHSAIESANETAGLARTHKYKRISISGVIRMALKNELF